MGHERGAGVPPVLRRWNLRTDAALPLPADLPHLLEILQRCGGVPLRYAIDGDGHDALPDRIGSVVRQVL